MACIEEGRVPQSVYVTFKTLSIGNMLDED